MSSAIQSVLRAIQKGDKEKTIKNLSYIPLHKISQEKFDRFLVLCLKSAHDSGQDHLITPIIKYFEGESYGAGSFSVLPLKTRLFLFHDLPDDILVEMGQQGHYGYTDFMRDVIRWDDSPEAVEICHRLTDVFGLQTLDIYQHLRNQLLDMEDSEAVTNYSVLEYIESMIPLTAPKAEKPEWVKNFTNGPLPLDDNLSLPPVPQGFALPNDEEAADLLIAGLQEIGIDQESVREARDDLLRHLAIATAEEKINILSPLIEIKENNLKEVDEERFRIDGPANPFLGLERGDECRMLTCIAFDNYSKDLGVIDEEIDLYPDPYLWFKGYCEICFHQIEKPCYAVRRPLPQGGWVQCFCSWDHVRETIDPDDLLSSILVDRFEAQIKRIGIQDREYNYKPWEKFISLNK